MLNEPEIGRDMSAEARGHNDQFINSNSRIANINNSVRNNNNNNNTKNTLSTKHKNKKRHSHKNVHANSLANSTKFNKEALKRKMSVGSSQGGSVCRICLGDENTDPNPLITPCRCAGTMKFIHIECLREWLNSKRSFKENLAVKTYCWKALECELCKLKFPDRILAPNGNCIDIISFERPANDYLVLESVT
jgi:hypothetical protein